MRKHNDLRVQRLKLKKTDYFIFLMVMLSMIFIVMAFGMYTNKARMEQNELIYGAMGNIANNQRNQFENYINERVSTLQALAVYPQIYRMDEEEQSKFIKSHSYAFGFEHIFIMNKEGKGYYIEEGVHRNQKDEPEKVKQKMSIFDSENSELDLVLQAITEKQDKRGRIVLEGIEYEAVLTYVSDYKWTIIHLIPVDAVDALYDFAETFRVIFSVMIVLLGFCIVRVIYCWIKSTDRIYTDALTKGNSYAACRALLDSLEKKRKQAVTIVFMDLNRFKYVNDTYGHDKGDELLRIFSDALGCTFGRVGFVGRMGGDEFIAVLLDSTEGQIQDLWTQLESRLKEKSVDLDFPYEITSSYGYATREIGGGESLDLIMQYADAKMYEYKVIQKKCKII